MIIVDTTIWSKVYRRRKIVHENKDIVNELCNILDMEQEVLIGPVRQELLSGIADRDIFDSLKIKLELFNNFSY